MTLSVGVVRIIFGIVTMWAMTNADANSPKMIFTTFIAILTAGIIDKGRRVLNLSLQHGAIGKPAASGLFDDQKNHTTVLREKEV